MTRFDEVNIGDSFHYLKVLRKERPKILVRCICGEERNIFAKFWGTQKSCGCIRKETKSSITHGHSSMVDGEKNLSPTYLTWRSMRARCYNKNSDRYSYYGGRGITVCDTWRTNFESFLLDMGERPYGTTLDRIDVNSNYCPENCRWATKVEQARNTRKTRYLELNGEKKCIKTWAEELGIKIKTLENRIHLGWSDQKALSTPVKGKS